MHANGLSHMVTVLLVVTGLCASTAQAVKPAINRDSLLEGRRVTNKPAPGVMASRAKEMGQPVGSSAAIPVHAPQLRKDGYKLRSTASGELPNGSGPLQNHHTRHSWCHARLFLTQRTGPLASHCLPQIMEYRIRRREAHSAHISFTVRFMSEASIDNGRKLYVKYDCRACHGDNGGETGGVNRRSLTRCGTTSHPIHESHRTVVMEKRASSQDLFRTLMTGLDGTPMPSYANEFAGQEEELWDLVRYLHRYLTTREITHGHEQPTERVGEHSG